METLESNSKNTYWKIFVNSNLPKMVTFINIDILNKNFNLHFDHTTYGKVAQDLWIHLQLFRE
jgi:hypothetical protein